jgi:hypothetical protein
MYPGPRQPITNQIGKLIFGSQGNESQKGIIVPGLFVSGGRNAERGMIALRVQDPTARHEETSNDKQREKIQSARRRISRCDDIGRTFTNPS